MFVHKQRLNLPASFESLHESTLHLLEFHLQHPFKSLSRTIQEIWDFCYNWRGLTEWSARFWSTKTWTEIVPDHQRNLHKAACSTSTTCLNPSSTNTFRDITSCDFEANESQELNSYREQDTYKTYLDIFEDSSIVRVNHNVINCIRR